MKKILAIALTGAISINQSMAQNISDVLRESQIFYGGTAKTTAMGGAVGSLGGDFSAISINPATLGVYRSNEFSFSPVFNINSVETKFAGETNNKNKFSPQLGNFGLVFVNNTGNDDGLVSLSYTVGYNRFNSYSEESQITGKSGSSLLENIIQGYNGVGGANGHEPGTLNSYWEDLFYQSYLIDYNSTTKNYTYNLPDPLRHNETQITKGSSGEWNFGIGANISHTLYLGASVNLTRSYYEMDNSHSEYEVANSSTFDHFQFDRHYESDASGYNFKFGAIARPIEWLRIGAAIHTPTYYKVNVLYNNRVRSYFKVNMDGKGNTSFDCIPSDNNGYLDDASFDYNQTTPWRYELSSSFVIGKKGLISVDYERVDYTENQISNTGFTEFETSINQDAQNVLKPVNNLRVGGELRLSPISLRLGAAYYESPWASSTLNKDANYLVLSGGLGYYNDNFFFDLAYSRMMQESYMYMYDDPSGVLSSTTMNKTLGKVVMTIGFRF
jgi:hypothetical protein